MMSIGGTVGVFSSATVIARAASSLTPSSDAARFPCCRAPAAGGSRKTRKIVCEVAIGSDSATSPSTSSSSSSSSSSADPSTKIGARVKVTAPLKVYHVPRVPEVDISGMEGELKQYVALWKGKRISANLPYKVQFFVDVQGRGSVKFFAHLKEDEFEFI